MEPTPPRHPTVRLRESWRSSTTTTWQSDSWTGIRPRSPHRPPARPATSEVQVRRARELVPGAGFTRADAATSELPQGSFDAVVSLYALIHVPSEDQAPSELTAPGPGQRSGGPGRRSREGSGAGDQGKERRSRSSARAGR
ncbi:class I SAM-dependent methyltransferase [Streptomyces sp. NPDC002886]|uniref:class I SAM-dependent methyltransferase n=1 Tax=Streptomyces sp. NPDC002886 TaxID=3364667 RepID=UPI0036B363AD